MRIQNKTKIKLLAVALALLSGCSKEESRDMKHHRIEYQETKKISPFVETNITTYLTNNYGWDRGNYRIQYQDLEAGIEHYIIIYLDDVERPKVSGGSLSQS
ncbi:hypothetical protein MLD52_18560 [Puniceicoccaceae bacterium K14]|nr:hypothetical protein [Puniceicoccaceae bacterium K14]